MKFVAALATLALSAFPVLAQQSIVTYDTLYDNSSFPLSSTACSNGQNGLETKFATLGNIQNFPYVGGIPGLTWNSPLCGTCWKLTYTTSNGQTNTINIVAVDASFSFNLSLEAMNNLTGGIAYQKGAVQATAVQVAASACGL